MTEDSEVQLQSWEQRPTNPAGASTQLRLVGSDYNHSAIEAVVRFKGDGCVHLRFYANGDDPDDENTESDYLHVCELDEHIRTMESLRDKLKELGYDD